MKTRILLVCVALSLFFAYAWSVSNPSTQMPTVEQLQSDYFKITDARFKAILLYTYQWQWVYGTAGHFVAVGNDSFISKGDKGLGYHSPEESVPFLELTKGYAAGLMENTDGSVLFVLGLGFDNQYVVYKITGPFQSETPEPDPITSDPGYLALLNSKFKLTYIGEFPSQGASYFGQRILGGKENDILYYYGENKLAWFHKGDIEIILESKSTAEYSIDTGTIVPGNDGDVFIVAQKNQGPQGTNHLYKLNGPFQPAAVADFIEY